MFGDLVDFEGGHLCWWGLPLFDGILDFFLVKGV